MKRIWKSLIGLVICLSVFISLVSCGLIGSFPGSEDDPPNVIGGDDYDDGLQYSGNAQMDETSIIGIAAFCEFETNAAEKLSKKIPMYDNGNDIPDDVNQGYDNKEDTTDGSEEENVRDEDGYLKISYPYDYVKIKSAYKFTINVPDIEDPVAKEIIEDSCGLGELEVVVAEFETYIDMNGYNILSVQDTLISLRGYNGYYTVLANSGALTDNAWLHVFSSHKKLNDEEVSKDFTPPILSIFLKEDGDSRYVYFETSDNLLSFGSYDQGAAFKNTTEVDRVSRNTLYSVLELTKVPIKTVEAVILEVDTENKIIKVVAQGRLEYVYVNENTEGLGLEDVSVGETVIIEYDLLFDRYDPVTVTANSVTLQSESGQTEEDEI